MKREYFDRLAWRGSTVVCIASGPSLTAQDCELVRRWRFSGESRRVIVINTSFRLAPWADVLYACDRQWWREYGDEARAVVTGELWSQDQKATCVNRIESVRLPGLGRRPGLIHQGGNSGHQVVNLAYQAGCDRIVLLGYDMQETGGQRHWHPDHPDALNFPGRFAEWVKSFEILARDLREEGVEVINASRETALSCFRRMPLEQVLEASPLPHS